MYSSVQFSCSVMSDSETLWTAARQASQSITNSRSLLKLMSIKSVMPSNHLILCHPLLLPLSNFPSIRVFSNESFFASGGQSTGFSFSISLSNEYSGLVSFRIDCLDLLAVQGTLKRLLQHQMWQHMATPNVFLGIYKFLSLRNIFLYQTGNNPSEYSLTLMLNSFTHAHLLKWQCVKK